MNTRNQKGFTIIETLVAITILMIAIAGPLTVANKGYTAAFDARDEAIANNLAQEELEYQNNMKDNWLAGGNSGWPTWTPCPSTICSAQSAFGIQISGTNIYGSSCAQSDDQCIVKITVSWTNGSGIGNSLQLQELLTNYIR